VTSETVAAVLAAVAAVAAASQLPALIARLPEPNEPADDKPLYADLARTPRLGLWCAVIAGLAAGVVGAVLGLHASLPAWVYLCVVGVGLSFIDWRTKLLPIRIVAPSYVVVAAVLVVAALAMSDWESLARAAIGWAATFLLFLLMWLVYPRGLGYGDVRLSGVLGMALAWEGWPQLVIGLYAAFLLGGIVGGVLSALKIVDRKGYPFGPFLMFGAWFAVVIGPKVTDWWS
jgi:leader peptidase (prepilin peptidase) / N-methyltransferase